MKILKQSFAIMAILLVTQNIAMSSDYYDENEVELTVEEVLKERGYEIVITYQ